MQSSAEIKWTKPQREGIETVGRSVLVSAAAGSGKTAVLAERCAHLICDAADPCDADELLVVTFTNAAAAEMRTRIEAALRRRLATSNDPARLARQLILLERASINTLHGFCTTILRQNFHAAALDPNFRVLDNEETRLLRMDIVRETLDEHYDADADGAFRRFISAYASGADDTLIPTMLRLHDLLGSVINPEAWLAESQRRINEAADADDITLSELGESLNRTIQSRLDDLRERWIALAEQLSQNDLLAPYLDHAGEMIAAVEGLRDAHKRGIDALSKTFAELSFGKLRPVRGDSDEKVTAKKQIDELRDELKTGWLATVCRFSSADWRDGLRAIREPTEILINLVVEFGKRFDAIKRQIRGLDFADLERFALKILGECEQDRLVPSDIAKSYQRRFKHVLVDEYQDINAVQDAILKFLSRETSDAELSNLFCVGDVKQSIYRFRLAEPEQFLKRYSAFSKPTQQAGRVIDLSANYRSRAPLLDVINGLFEKLMTGSATGIEYDASHRLHAGATFPPIANDCFHGAPVELHILPTDLSAFSNDEDPEAEDDDLDRTEREAVFIAGKIRAMLGYDVGRPMQVAEKSADGTAILRPIRCKDIVILLRSMRHKAEQFAAVLRAAGVAVHTDSATGFFDSTEIRDMLALLKLLDNQQQDIPLAAVLRSPISPLKNPADTLAKIRLAYPDAKAIPFHRAAMLYADRSTELTEFFTKLQTWRRMAHERPLAELIWHLYDCTGYLAFCSGLHDGEQRVANLLDLHQRAKQFGTFQRQGLGRFMEFLDNLAEESDLGQSSIASEADDVVRIMSVHKSKGLEFPVVFLPDLGKKHNLQDSAGAILFDRERGIGLAVIDQQRQIKYESLAHLMVQERIRQQSLADELRVLYVAMTRAKEHLVLVGTSKTSPIKSWRAMWSQHDGPLPAQRVLGASSMLDWIGPVAAMMEAAGQTCRIEMQFHEGEEEASTRLNFRNAAKLPVARQPLAKLVPLDPAPGKNLVAEQVIAHLSAKYPHALATRQPAVESVGKLTKHFDDLPFQKFPRDEAPIAKCLSGDFKPKATEIGDATHRVLEHLDYAKVATASEIKLQIESLVHRKLLRSEIAAHVDYEAIEWLLGSEVGTLLRDNAKSLRRELPVHFPMQADGVDSSDPMDRVMVRGRIDVLVIRDNGLTIVDFKTDNIALENVDARVAIYRPQVEMYREAISKITGKPTDAYLVFLTPRVIRAV